MRQRTQDWLFIAGATGFLAAVAATLRCDLGGRLMGWASHYGTGEKTATWVVVGAIGGLGWALAVYGLRRSRRLQAAPGQPLGARLPLERRELGCRLLSEHLPFALLGYDDEGRIVHSNERFRALAGTRREALEGRRVDDLIPGVAGIVPHVVGVIEIDRTLRTDAEEEVAVHLVISSIAEPSAGIRGGLVLVSDLPAEHKDALPRWIRQGEPRSAMGTLLAGVAHEVRNPLFGISTTLDAFEARLETDHPHRGFLRALRKEVNRMGDLMTELLDYGRPVDLQPSVETLQSMVFEAIEHCHALTLQRDVTVKVETPRDLPAIRMDRRHTVRVLKHLIANAVQHSPRRGEVRVRLEATDDGRQRCTVRDQGKGFAEQALDRIFEPFYSKRQGGVGLGLSIVQRFVHELGGTVRAFNHLEGGAAVEVSFPASVCNPMDLAAEERAAS